MMSGQPDPTRRYATQQLSQVQEAPRRRGGRTGLVIIVAVLVLVAGAGAAWWLVSRGGEEQRAAYCRALRQVSHHGDLEAAMADADLGDLADLQRVIDLAPESVAGDWEALRAFATRTVTSQQIDADAALEAVGHAQRIIGDAREECGIEVQLPWGM